jgi:hypothetical protein
MNGKYLNVKHSGILLRHKLHKQAEINQATTVALMDEVRDANQYDRNYAIPQDGIATFHDPLSPTFDINEPLLWSKRVGYDCVMSWKKYLAEFGENACRMALAKGDPRKLMNRKTFENVLRDISGRRSESPSEESVASAENPIVIDAQLNRDGHRGDTAYELFPNIMI